LALANKTTAGGAPDADILRAKAELLYLTGDRAGAVVAYDATYRARPQAAMAQYWSAIIRLELGRDAGDDLRALLKHPMMSQFGAVIIHLRLRDGGKTEILREAQLSGPDAPCIAHFNLGHDAWLRGDKAQARDELQQAVATGRIDMPEYRAAKLILSKL